MACPSTGTFVKNGFTRGGGGFTEQNGTFEPHSVLVPIIRVFKLSGHFINHLLCLKNVAY